MAGLVLIDVDGVIAPFAKYPQDLSGAVVEEVPGFGGVIILKDRIADLTRIASETGSELLFHTSWDKSEANRAFAKFFGRELEAVSGGLARAVWWKLDAVEDALPQWATEGRRVVWLDDMLDDENDFGDTWGELGQKAAEEAGVPMLVIVPDKYTGLTEEHIEAIAEFLAP